MRNRRWRRRFFRDLVVGNKDAGTIPAKYINFTMNGVYWLGVHVDRYLFKTYPQIADQE